jgi:ABC-type thiamin/hydroxymethylpyrimidine transport system permease subunit
VSGVNTGMCARFAGRYLVDEMLYGCFCGRWNEEADGVGVDGVEKNEAAIGVEVVAAVVTVSCLLVVSQDVNDILGARVGGIGSSQVLEDGVG